MGAYSILYDGWEEGDDAYAQYAVDWSFEIPGQWSRSDKGGPGTRWYCREGLDNKGYRVSLKHFGLEDYADEFPIERITTMSPKNLVIERRKREELHSLERKEMLSDTLGDHSPAEEFE